MVTADFKNWDLICVYLYDLNNLGMFEFTNNTSNFIPEVSFTQTDHEILGKTHNWKSREDHIAYNTQVYMIESILYLK